MIDDGNARVDLDSLKRVHLLGIGGIGVSAVARLLLARGIHVTGSDVRESSITRELRKEGASVTIGHRPENPVGADLVVVSSAIPDNNPELIAAQEAGLAVVHRSVVLAAMMRQRRSLGITGTNGKGS
ncbi:MAG: UDP-N-acetylmuramate--L-alanine ligase, partial [Deltaproteobacteria bacterium]|nr:UDP-N-acetylmuramate--L-alanine ligase [Deltaproteobacteria bacterium]